MFLGSLGLGAANLGNLHAVMSDEESREILESAWDLGIRYFDTAPHYGLGLSERRLGAFLRTKPRDEFVVSTKVGRLLRPHPHPETGRSDTDGGFMVPAELTRVWDASASGIAASLAESLDRLGLDRVDILYLHDPEQHDLEESLSTGLTALAELRDRGVVRAIGVGSMDTPALLAAAQSGKIDLLMVAGRYTLLEQSVVPEVIDACAAQGVDIVAASVFNSGLLATAVPSERSLYDYAAVPSELLSRAREIAAVCEEFGVELPVAALQFPLRDSRVRSVVVGASSAAQLRSNARRIRVSVPGELWSELARTGLVSQIPA